MVQYYISIMFYNNMFLQESIVFLACPVVLRISMTQRKPLKILRSRPIIVSRFTKWSMNLMQKVYMNLFHLLATYFPQSAFFFSLLTLTVLGIFEYMLRKEGVGGVLLHHYDIFTRQTQNLEFMILSPSCYGAITNINRAQINVGRRCVIIQSDNMQFRMMIKGYQKVGCRGGRK